MAIKKQNRALLIFVTVILGLLAFSLFREGKLTKPESEKSSSVAEETPKSPETGADSPSTTDEGSEANQNANDSRALEKQKVFAQIISDLAECFDYKISEPSSSAPVTLDSLLLNFQSELGPVTHQTDKWVEWHLRTIEGGEKRLRLEISENDDGSIRKELHYYVIDRSGHSVLVDMEPSQAVNPSDQTLNDLLRDGDVFLKELAGTAVFPGGEQLNYTQKNDELSGIEFVKGERFFQCLDLNHREECQCMK